MKAIIALLALSPFTLFAHPGHPGPATHGDFTHLLIGTFIALPIALLVVNLVLNIRQKAHAKVRKHD